MSEEDLTGRNKLVHTVMPTASSQLVRAVQSTGASDLLRAVQSSLSFAKQITGALRSIQLTSSHLEQIKNFKRTSEMLQFRAAQYTFELAKVISLSPMSNTLKQLESQFVFLAKNNTFFKMKEAIEKRQQTLEQFILLLAELEWTPALAVTYPDMSMWIRLAQQNGIEAVRDPINKFIIKLYDEEVLLSILEEWSQHKHLKPRMHILEAAVKAHIRGEYVLSVPALIAQIEGFIASLKNHRGQMKGSQYKTFLLEAIGTQSTVQELMTSFITDHLLERFGHGDPIPSISRHAILHGGDVDYGTCETSLKIILFIDWLSLNTQYEIPA